MKPQPRKSDNPFDFADPADIGRERVRDPGRYGGPIAFAWVFLAVIIWLVMFVIFGEICHDYPRGTPIGNNRLKISVGAATFFASLVIAVGKAMRRR